MAAGASTRRWSSPTRSRNRASARDVVSPAGAYGLMQIRPAAATDIARASGRPIDLRSRRARPRPSTNIEIGQSYLEQLRDQPATGGLLPKVIAAYNAGPVPVAAWNADARDDGDPLLYIESIPYWETRGYVVTVLRNYWMYEARGRQEIAQPRRAGAGPVAALSRPAGRRARCGIERRHGRSRRALASAN